MEDSDSESGGAGLAVECRGGPTSSGGAGGAEEGLTAGQRGPAPFLLKTYNIVDDPETNEIVSWNKTGTSFIIWKQEDFCQKVLPTAFKHSNQSSFVRQLNIYGFKKVTSQRQEFAHHFFLRDDKSKLHLISRTGQCGQNEAVHQVRNENQWLKQQLQQCMALYELVVQQVEAWGIPRDALSQRLGVHLPHSDPKLPVQLLLGKPVVSGDNPLVTTAAGPAPSGRVCIPGNPKSAPLLEVAPSKGKEPAVGKGEDGTGTTRPGSASSLALLSKMLTQQQSSQSILPHASSPLQVEMPMLPDQRAALQAQAALLAAQRQQMDAATVAAQTQLLQALLSQSNRQQAMATQRQAFQSAGMGLDLSLQPPSLRPPQAEAGQKRERDDGEGEGRPAAIRSLKPSQGSAFSRPVFSAQGRGMGCENARGGLASMLAQLNATASTRGGHAMPSRTREGTLQGTPSGDGGGDRAGPASMEREQMNNETSVRSFGMRGSGGGTESKGEDRDSEKGSMMLFGVKLSQ